MFHGASGDRGGGVILLPPFGWDEVCSYRSRRAWALWLAAAGYPSLRLDLPSAGDSEGTPDAAGRLANWTDAVGCGAERLRGPGGCGWITAIGVGLGGLVGLNAMAMGAEIDDLVLWATPSRGRTLVREMRAFAGLEASRFGISEPTPLPTGWLEVAGFVLSEQTLDALSALEVASMAPERRSGRRALLLERDGLPVDPGLAAWLRGEGFDVTEGPGDGYGAMMAEPAEARPPEDVFAQVGDWLARHEDPRPHRASTDERPAAMHPVGGPAPQLVDPDGAFGEQPGWLELADGGRLFAVSCAPVASGSGELTLVLLNAGAVRRTGPNRMWVEVARRWAARGVNSVRLDVEGIGDADGDGTAYADVGEFYVPHLVGQVRQALDALAGDRAHSRFVLIGLCSGAYWAFHGALEDSRVVAAVMLNPRVLYWDSGLEARRAAREVGGSLARGSSWRRVLEGRVSPARMLGMAIVLIRRIVRAGIESPARLRDARRRRRAGGDEVELALDRLRDSDKRLLLAFSGSEPLRDELERDGHLSQLARWPNLELADLPGSVHTLRPLNAQRAAHDLIDRVVEAELESSPTT
jgi:alpha-beta hydrolase superfamily lysophospholipase